MAALIEIANLQPAARLRARGEVQLVVTQHGVALGGEGLAQLGGTGGLADRGYEQLKADPRHPSLHLKRIGRFWSVRVGIRHRALAVQASHDELLTKG